MPELAILVVALAGIGILPGLCLVLAAKHPVLQVFLGGVLLLLAADIHGRGMMSVFGGGPEGVLLAFSFALSAMVWFFILRLLWDRVQAKPEAPQRTGRFPP